jgi:hypothetical protein
LLDLRTELAGPSKSSRYRIFEELFGGFELFLCYPLRLVSLVGGADVDVVGKTVVGMAARAIWRTAGVGPWCDGKGGFGVAVAGAVGTQFGELVFGFSRMAMGWHDGVDCEVEMEGTRDGNDADLKGPMV